MLWVLDILDLLLIDLLATWNRSVASSGDEFFLPRVSNVWM